MGKGLALGFALLLAGLGILHAQSVLGFPPGVFQSRGAIDAAGGFAPTCTESGNFLARTSGQDDTHKAAYDALICGLVAQNSTISGTLFSRLDGLWMLRAADTTVYKLNLISSSFPLTQTGAVTFVANAGVTSDGMTGFYDTGFNPSTASSPQYVQDSGTIAACTTAALTGGSGVFIGLSEGGVTSQLVDLGVISGIVNTNAGIIGAGAGAALYQVSRTGSTTSDLYTNGSSDGSSVAPSAGLGNGNFYVLARDSSGTAGNFTTTEFTMVALGASFSATDVANFRTLIAAYMAAIGSAAC